MFIYLFLYAYRCKIISAFILLHRGFVEKKNESRAFNDHAGAKTPRPLHEALFSIREHWTWHKAEAHPFWPSLPSCRHVMDCGLTIRLLAKA